MRVERYGTGARTFLCLHGWGSDHSVFAPLAAHVPADASLYGADLPGCGSTALPREWSARAIVEEIVETIHALGAERVTLVGHCGGAVFGLLAARNAGGLIERVVALDPFAYLPRYFRLFTGERFGRRAYDATFANALGRWVTNRALNAGRAHQTDLTASFGATDHEVARCYLQLFDAMNGVEEVRGLQTRVDLVYGAQTFGAVRKSVALLRDALPRSRVIELKGARHMPIAEATAQLARVIFAPGRAVEDEQLRSGNQAARAAESRLNT